MSWTPEERFFMVKFYFLCGESASAAQKRFGTHFKIKKKENLPTIQTISSWVNALETKFSLLDANEDRTGRPKTARSSENINVVEDMVTDDPNISMRELAASTSMSKSTVHRIVRLDLGLFPYKIQVHQPLTDSSIVRRFNFANEMLTMIEDGTIDINKIIFTDECHFHLQGYVNKQNWRHWGSEKPDFSRIKPLHPQRVTVFAGIHAGGIIGPYCFPESVTGEKYHSLLVNKVLPAMYDKEIVSGYWWMQDGAPPHRVQSVIDLLDQNFYGRVIALGYPERYGRGMAWPPYSPDLNPMDFFAWGYTKDKVYRSEKHSLDSLHTAIKNVFSQISTETCAKVIENFEKRLRHVVASEGKNFENLIH
ncbi:histone-lysine N-methyltransferase SETMAR-like [Tetranychus urticae]|uniref:histone-lysine N-methyltransferase SETMAR-like n=1 Tax=Tetranychus urticae TaxID=32264 RepID=UPI000D65B02B|nr:histone-lysine N-methyltransferase SETMAR-like [Tetranychus urticae]